MSLCHYGLTYLSTQTILNMSLKNMYFCHSGLTLSILLCHSVLYSVSLYVWKSHKISMVWRKITIFATESVILKN